MRTLKLTTGPVEIEGEVVLGRENADVVIADSEMSRRHAVLRPVERGVEVEDLGSMNGTFVNGERIATPVTLTSSGTLRMGTTEMEIEIMVADVTVARDIPTPDVTVAREMPDVTVARDVPEVTAVRQTPPQGAPTGPPRSAGPPPGAGPPGGGPPGGGPPGGGPPGGGPPGGPPRMPLPARLVLKYPPARMLLPKMKGPIPLRLLLTFLITVLLPLAVIAVLVLVVL